MACNTSGVFEGLADGAVAPLSPLLEMSGQLKNKNISTSD